MEGVVPTKTQEQIMKIYVNTQILSGNLGDGWNDQNGAADALGEYTEKTWLADLSTVIADGHEVEISIDVQHNTEGASRDVSVDVEPADYDQVQRVEGLLTAENTIWERFCESDEAAQYASE